MIVACLRRQLCRENGTINQNIAIQCPIHSFCCFCFKFFALHCRVFFCFHTLSSLLLSMRYRVNNRPKFILSHTMSLSSSSSYITNTFICSNYFFFSIFLFVITTAIIMAFVLLLLLQLQLVVVVVVIVVVVLFKWISNFSISMCMCVPSNYYSFIFNIFFPYPSLSFSLSHLFRCTCTIDWPFLYTWNWYYRIK